MPLGVGEPRESPQRPIRRDHEIGVGKPLRVDRRELRGRHGGLMRGNDLQRRCKPLDLRLPVGDE